MFLKTRHIWKCSKCRKQFSIETKSVFEDSPIPLDKWFAATWIIANCKNGISSYEIKDSSLREFELCHFVLARASIG